MAEEIRAMSDEELENIQGGMILNATGLPECDPFRPWEIIHNNTGEVLGRFATQAEACEAVKAYHSGSSYDGMLVSYETVDYLRKHPQIIGR